MEFLNRERELDLLERWWSSPPQSKLGLLWGRRRVGKTALLQRFAEGKRVVFHTGAGRPLADELRILSRLTAGVIEPRSRGPPLRGLGGPARDARGSGEG